MDKLLLPIFYNLKQRYKISVYFPTDEQTYKNVRMTKHSFKAIQFRVKVALLTSVEMFMWKKTHMLDVFSKNISYV